MVTRTGILIERSNDSVMATGTIELDYEKTSNNKTSLTTRFTSHLGEDTKTEVVEEKRFWFIREDLTTYLYYYNPGEELIRIAYLPNFGKLAHNRINISNGQVSNLLNKIESDAINAELIHLPAFISIIPAENLVKIKQKFDDDGNPKHPTPEERVALKIQNAFVSYELPQKSDNTEQTDSKKDGLDSPVTHEENELAPVPLPTFEMCVNSAFAKVNQQQKYHHLPRGLIEQHFRDELLNLCEHAQSVEEFQEAIIAVVTNNVNEVPIHLETNVAILRHCLFPSNIERSFAPLTPKVTDNSNNFKTNFKITFQEVDDFSITWLQEILASTGHDISTIQPRVLSAEIANSVIGTLNPEKVFTGLSAQEDHVFTLIANMRSRK